MWLYGYFEFLKGPDENLYFLAPAQTKLMQPILMPCEAQFRSNLQKKQQHWTSVLLQIASKRCFA